MTTNQQHNQNSRLTAAITVFSLLILLLCGGALLPALAQERPLRNNERREVLSRRAPEDDSNYVPLSAPLAKDDPRAQLDPKFLNYQPIELPLYRGGAAADQRVSGRLIEHDLRTGKTKEYSSGALTERGATTELLESAAVEMPGNFGAVPLFDFGAGKTDDANQTAQSRECCGVDNRVLINNTTAYPWRTVTKLFGQTRDGSQYVCSGVLISAKYVLTAAHCVYDRAHGGWAAEIIVVPGLNGTYVPYGAARAVNTWAFNGFINSDDQDYDMALVTLNVPIGNTVGWMGYGSYATVNGLTANVAGYPGDRDDGVKLYYHFGPVFDSTPNQLFYTLDTSGGQSGSGVFRVANQQYTIFGVHTFGSPQYNGGTRLNAQKLNAIRTWIASGQ